MAGRAEPVSAVPGHVAAAGVAAIILGALIAVFWRAEAGQGLGPSDWAAIRFTGLQAILSASLSVVLAIPVARALARRQFPGRAALVTLLGAPFILPVIVAVLGLLAVFGRSGWVSEALVWAGLPPLQIYGLHGVVLAHVFFNLPLATRLILQGWRDVPAEQFRLAAQLGFGPRETARRIEWPMLARTVPGVWAVIFAICITSFAVALTLGGGPRATTVELAIYQAFWLEFDLGRAALLSVVQIVLAGLAAAIALRLTPFEGLGAGLDRAARRWDVSAGRLIALDAMLIALAALFLLLPLAAIVSAGLGALGSLPDQVWRAAGVSVAVALVSTAVLLVLALPMAWAIASGRAGGVEVAGILGLAASPLVIGTGFFVILNPVVNPQEFALGVTALVNALMALPFALRILVPGAREVARGYGRLAVSLDMRGWPYLRHVFLPRMRARIGFAAGLTAALSMGDLGVVVLFADPEMATLPLQMYRLMAAYQMETAAGAGLVLLVLSLVLFWGFDAGGRRGAQA
ncbi:MAG: thiamine/thiamine pyrophosphate ABC transporter permease ThiP [Aestuariivita sp.]|uniref:thiamine/thiamine pyrophosphate ABC transporter permease ThiP n=1 Tax=Aestuariivita sp. TaxID=1872407 RepID=UPI003BB08D35